MHLVDFHCHLDLYANFTDILCECERLGIFTLAVTTTPKAWPRNYELTRKTRNIRAALGFHPQLVNERAHEFLEWQRYLPEARFVGEVGLDASPRFYKSFEIQKRVFEAILINCADSGGKILSVHSVRAVTAVLDLIEAHLLPARSKIVLHWFSGSRSEAQRAIDLGCYFSVNIEMLKSDKGRNLVYLLPKNRLLTETDGPFVRKNNEPVKPFDVAEVVEGLALLHELPSETMSGVIIENLYRLLCEDT